MGERDKLYALTTPWALVTIASLSTSAIVYFKAPEFGDAALPMAVSSGLVFIGSTIAGASYGIRRYLSNRMFGYHPEDEALLKQSRAPPLSLDPDLEARLGEKDQQ